MNKNDFIFAEAINQDNSGTFPICINKKSISIIVKCVNSLAIVYLIGDSAPILLNISYEDLLIDLFNQ